MSLFKTKTFWTGIAAVATAAGAYLGGEAGLMEAAQTAFTGLAAIFLRAGILSAGQE